MKQFNGPDTECKDIIMVSEFMNLGLEHGTLAEAVYYALKAALTGEATTMEEALQIGAGEWYK